MRVKLDENQPHALVAVFEAAGHQVDTAAAEGLSGATDEQLAARCRAERQALLTFDLDFADLRQYPRRSLSRVISG